MARRFTVLCIDDEPVALKMRTLVLEHEGYRVLAASSADEALNLFASENIDLVLSDHLLRETTGAQIAAKIKMMKPNVPVVLISGLPDRPEGAENVDAFISKGSDVEEVLRTIRSMLPKAFRCP